MAHRHGAWRLKLGGDAFDLDRAARDISSGPTRVVQQNDGFYLYSSALDGITDPHKALSTATEVLAQINGSLLVGYPDSQALVRDILQRESSDGSQPQQFIFASSFSLRAEMNAVIADEQGNVGSPAWSSVASHLVYLGLGDPRIREALFHFQERGGWFSLFKVYEIVCGDVGGVKKMEELGLVPSVASVERFKRAANDAAVSGRSARHACSNRAPAVGMTMAEGQDFVREFLRRWLKAKSEA